MYKYYYKFLGPAEHEFSTFPDLCIYSLNTHWPGWRDYEKPESFIVPPIFSYQFPDRSDSQIDECRSKEGFQRSVIDRDSCLAEHLVYQAVYQLINSKSLCPILAVHKLCLFKFRSHLGKLFAHWYIRDPTDQIIDELILKSAQELFREDDFILMGPKIGLVHIEVKSSHFKKFFTKKRRFLPKQIKEGVDQLEIFQGFLNFLKECTGIDPPKVTKILFTANLEKQPFNNWFETLDVKDKKEANLESKGIFHLFKDDALDSGSLCKKLEEIMKSCPTLLPEIYEIYAPLIVGLNSVKFLKNQIEIRGEKLSENQAVLQECPRLESQDPCGSGLKVISDQHKTVSTQQKCQIPYPQTVTHFSKVIILTPDQQKAMKGPDRQIIIGAAGTGKTIILQEKALQLIRKNQSVLILAAWNYRKEYERLLSDCDRGLYTILAWTNIRKSMMSGALKDPLFRELLKISSKNGDYVQAVEMILRNRAENPGWLSGVFEWILKCDHVLIDDAIDDERNETSWLVIFHLILISMAFARGNSDKKMIWIALDYHIQTMANMEYDNQLGKKKIVWNQICRPLEFLLNTHELIDSNLAGNLKNEAEDLASVVILRQNMRCAENIFQAIYEWESRLLPCLTPVPGHKIQGVCKSLRKSCQTVQEALETICIYVRDELCQLRKDGIDFGKMAIITDSRGISAVGPPYYYQLSTSIKKCILERFKKFDTWRTDNEPCLNVFTFYEVSSMEWPVVIRAACVASWLGEPAFAYSRYRVCTRAIGKLVDITVTFHDDEVCN